LGPMGGVDNKGSDPAKSSAFDPRIVPDPLSNWGKSAESGGGADPNAQEARKQLLEWAKRFENLASKMEDSPALQQALRDLSRAALDMQGNAGSSDQPIDK